MGWAEHLHPEASWPIKVALNGVRPDALNAKIAASPIPRGHVDAITGIELFEATGWSPHEFQERALGIARPGTKPVKKYRALDVSRNGGKTTVQAAGALEVVSTYRRVDVGVLGPKLDQSKILLGDVRDFYMEHKARFGDRMPDLVNERARDADELIFSNGSRVVALSAHAGVGQQMGVGSGNRGLRLKRLIGDEAAWIPKDAVDTLIAALAARGGDAIFSSTVWFDTGWWWDLIHPRVPSPFWEILRATVDDLPHISEEHKAFALDYLGREKYDRDYYGIPPKRRGTLIDHDAIAALGLGQTAPTPDEPDAYIPTFA